MTYEKKGGVSSKERSQVDRSKTQAEQYSEHHKLNNSPFVESDKTEDRGSKSKVIVLE